MVGPRGQHIPHAVRRGQEVGRAEPPGHLLLGRIGVHGHDGEGAREPRALDDVQPDPARADDDHAVPPVHPGPVQDRADPGEHPAPDERGGGQGDVPGDAHGLHGLDDRAFREGRVGGELVHRLRAPRERSRRAPDRLPAHGRPSPVALRARPAVGERGQGHVVTGRDMGDAGAHRLHDSGTLVAQHHRYGEGDGAVHHRQIAVAQPGRRDGDQHLAGTRFPYRQIVDDPDPPAVEHHTPHHTAPFGSPGRPSTRSAMMVRWIWSEPP